MLDLNLVYLPICVAGTLWYRYDSGQLTKRELLVGAAVVVTYIIAIPISSNWLFGWLLAVGIFALYHVGRTATWPRWLVWCGVVSYSLYLLHTLPLNWFGVWGAPLAIALAGISYRLIEQPMIRLGRSLDRSAARAPARAPA